MQLVKIESAWPTVRGAGALTQAAAATGSSVRVQVVAGHLLAIGRQGTAVVAFDAVPSTGWQLPEPAHAQLAQLLNAAPADPVVITDPLKPLLISTSSQPNTRVVGVFFQATMNMRKIAPPVQVTPTVVVAPATAVPGPNAGMPAPGLTSSIGAGSSAGFGPQGPAASAAVPPDPSKGPFVWIVRENGILELWRLVRRKYVWVLLVKTRLPVATSGSSSERQALIADVAFQPIPPGASETTMVLAFTEVSTNRQNKLVTDVWSQCLLVENTAQDQTQLQCSLPKPVLRGIPPVSMAVMDSGIAFLPTPARLATASSAGAATDEDVCFFWSAEAALSSLWSNTPAPTTASATGSAGATGAQPVLVSVIWGRSLAATDGPASTDQPASAARMCAYATHPVTRELLVLDDAGQITVCTFNDGTLQFRPVVTLKDAPGTSGVAVAVAYHRLHILVADPSGLTLYHVSTGHRAATVPYPPGLAAGATPALWQIHSTVAQLGIYHPRVGVWQLQTPAIANTLMPGRPSDANAVPSSSAHRCTLSLQCGFWVKQYAAAPTAPSNTVAEAVFATEKWGLDRLRAKHILDAAFVLVQAGPPTTATASSPAADSAEPPTEPVRAALALLERELIETPALAIAVLNELPQYRTILAGYLARFVQKYDAKYRAETTSPIAEALRVRTPLGDQLRPLIEAYLSSVVNEEQRLHAPDAVAVPIDRITVGALLIREPPKPATSPPPAGTSPALSPRETAPLPSTEEDARFYLASDVKSEALAIFNRAATSLRATKQSVSTQADRTRLESLAWAHPAQVLAALMQGLHFDKFHEDELPDGAEELLLLQAFFREETLQSATDKDHGLRSARPPLFELLCSVLVREQPSSLAAFVAVSNALVFKAQAAQAKTSYQRMNQRPSQKDLDRGLDTFRRRAINAVVPLDPSVIASYRDPASSLRAITQLLASVGEGATGLRLVLHLRRWDDAIELAQELRVTSSGETDLVEQYEVFYALVTAVLTASPPVAPAVLDRVWKLVPSNFGIFDMMRLLRSLDSPPPSAGGVLRPLADGASTAWTVGVFRAQLLELFRREAGRIA